MRGPSEETIGQRAAWELVLNVVGEAGGVANGFELVSVGPLGERAAYLDVFEKVILLVRGVAGEPPDGADLEFYFGTGFDAASLAKHAHLGEGRAQDLQGVRPFVESEDGGYRRVDDCALDEGRHITPRITAGCVDAGNQRSCTRHFLPSPHG